MSQTPNPDPHLECCLRRDGTQLTIPRESTVTPVERPLTASQARNQRLLSQEPVGGMVEESAPEGTERTLDSPDQQQDHPHDDSQNPHPDISGLDL